MTRLLAVAGREETIRELSRFFVRGGDRGNSTWLILLLAVLVMGLSAYYVWRWQTRVARQVSAAQLLRRLGDRLGLTYRQRSLVRRIARAAELEPAVALLSPSLLAQMVQRGEQAGLHLTTEQTLQVGRILDTVASAANAA